MCLFPQEANTYTDSRERAWAQRVSASLGVYDEDQEEDEWGIPDTLYKVLSSLILPSEFSRDGIVMAGINNA